MIVTIWHRYHELTGRIPIFHCRMTSKQCILGKIFFFWAFLYLFKCKNIIVDRWIGICYYNQLQIYTNELLWFLPAWNVQKWWHEHILDPQDLNLFACNSCLVQETSWLKSGSRAKRGVIEQLDGAYCRHDRNKLNELLHISNTM